MGERRAEGGLGTKQQNLPSSFAGDITSDLAKEDWNQAESAFLRILTFMDLHKGMRVEFLILAPKCIKAIT